MAVMNSAWQQWLNAAGAHFEIDVVQDFGDPRGELEAARSRSVLADLSHLGVLDVTGPDSEAFLQAQLTCDVRAIGASSGSYGSYCTPKGRMLADFLLWRLSAGLSADGSSGFRMVLSRSVVSTVQKRLRMYVLRLKVQVIDASDSAVLLGVSGDGAARALGSVLTEVPQEARDHELRHFGNGSTAISLGGRRFLIAVAVEGAAKLWADLAATLRPVGTPCWEWLEIRSGVPLVTAATQEQFLPQMTNLELIGGVSFKKGCFPGQEIVARTQHLGKVKRRMFLAHVDEAQTPPSPGADIFSDDIPGQASGTVVNAQAAPGGGYDLLAVVHHSSRESSTVHLDASDGPVLRFLELPYAVT
jgi:tRNA-modifying protein YgfZ